MRAIASTMPAAVYRGGGKLEVEARPVPSLGPTVVLIEVSHCGVCGTDLHEVLDGWGIVDTVGGHEYAGVVRAVGSDVTRWRPGDPVAGAFEPGCGSCAPCGAGRTALCLNQSTPGTVPYQGAFATHVRIDEQRILRVPDGLPLRTAALTEPLAVALHGIDRSGARRGHRVLVSGAGPIGALTLAALVAMGVDDVTVVEPGKMRRQLASQLGARALRLPDELDVPTIAEPGRIVDDAVDVVIETSGRRAALEAGLAQLARAGTLVIVGSGIDPPRFDPNRILLNELVVTGAFGSDAAGFERALELLAAGRLPVEQLLHPDDIPLDGLLEAMRALAGGSIAGKALVYPGGDR
jgi:threonine dehydrogenase-like Zn-dependent dehydrogenase